MGTNTKDLAERLIVGKLVEAEILDFLNRTLVVLKGCKIDRWLPATKEQDMHLKVDAWAFSPDEGCEQPSSVQIKYREGGSDLGVAVLRPFDNNQFLQDYPIGLDLDRDMQHTPDIYVCKIDDDVYIVPGEKVKLACGTMIDKLYEAGGFGYKSYFEHEKCWGAQLRLIEDRGHGYSYGQKKVICYIKPELLMKAGAVRVTYTNRI